MKSACFMIKCKPRRGKSWLIVSTARSWRNDTIKDWERETGHLWAELKETGYSVVKVECNELEPARRTRKKAQA